MKKIKNLLFLTFLICTYSSYGQWTEIDHDPVRFIETLNFLDDNMGYVLMNNENGNIARIRKTVDAGTNWIELNLPVQTGEFQDIFFYAEGEGVVLIRNLNNAVPTKIYQTVDDGETWEDISPEATVTGLGSGQCQFLNQDVGFFVSEKTLYSTTNGGESWTLNEFDEYILSLDFLDAEHGVLGTYDGTFNYKGGMLSTSDGGLSWTNTLLDENYTSIKEVQQISNSVAFAAPVHSWASILAGQFYKTTDGGANWNVIEIPMPADGYTLRQVDFRDDMYGVICVGNHTTTKIYRTSNSGQTWNEEGTITSTYDSDLQLTPSSGYIGGKKGSFYKRTEPTSAKEVPTELGISLFPSPARLGETINWTSSENFTNLLIIDQRGTMVHQQYLNQKHGILPQLNSGFYFVQLLNEKFFTTTKLIVE